MQSRPKEVFLIPSQSASLVVCFLRRLTEAVSWVPENAIFFAKNTKYMSI